MSLLIAFGTDDGKNLPDGHVGNAGQYFVYRFSDGKMEFVEKRDNPKFAEDESLIHGDPAKAANVGSVLKGVDVIVGKVFGPNIVRMKKKFVCVVARANALAEALEIISENIDIIRTEKEKGESRKHLVLKKGDKNEREK